MKKLITIALLMYVSCIVFAQETSAEAEVRKLEEQERQAVLKKDTAALGKIWDKHFVVNAPNNRVVVSEGDIASRPVIAHMGYASFTREIEQILVRGNVVFCMGNEVVMPAENYPRAGKEIRRRYTNVWMKENGVWTLVARHASEICPDPVQPKKQ